ncbi:MAG: acyl-CoA dehydrogenase family protein [Candidatus Marinimicrobia bacterium]|nr:acyl-CoA dehydrogenase family protein [Candidatus Neomarinimicrobiota bacterium]
MANFYTDNPDIEYNLKRLNLKELADFLEGDYSDSKKFDYAPENADDTIENYLSICKLAGELCAGPIAERASQIDEEGHECRDGDVIFHPLVKANLRDFRRAQLLGVSLPRRYGGLNMPQAIKNAVIEMVSRADASLMNLVGLQDIAETINEFGSEEQKETYIPKLASGEATGAMVLTEADSGSDLQSVRLQAIPPSEGGDDGVWHLHGVKRFITNGCGDILLVLARSEEGTTDARGLSLFICSKDETIYIRRIENKLGIHGSPTCEIVFDHTPAYLVGRRKRGLIKYVMSLMNGARLGISAQSLGIAEAAYRTARKYAESRVQFDRPIIDFPPVYEMLTNMKMNIEAGRLLLYETAKVVDLFKIPAVQMEEAKKRDEAANSESKKNVRYYERLTSVLTPMTKYFTSEMCNRAAYNGMQVMGGSGYMKDYDMERYYRDARITNIYEGTSQLQIVGAIGGLLAGTMNKVFDDFVAGSYPDKFNKLSKKAKAFVPQYYKAVEFVKQKKDSDYTNFVARRLVDMAIDIYVSFLFLECARDNTRKASLAEIWIQDAKLRVESSYRFIVDDRSHLINLHKDIIG